jgi:hypothetical protein
MHHSLDFQDAPTGSIISQERANQIEIKKTQCLPDFSLESDVILS